MKYIRWFLRRSLDGFIWNMNYLFALTVAKMQHVSYASRTIISLNKS
jgi:hypothetical protein